MMKASVRWLRLGSFLLLGVVALVPGCDSPREIAPLRDGLAACEELVAYCEAPAAALGEPYLACFETGDDNVGNACLHAYDDCIPACKTALGELEGAGGEGGGGGAPTDGGAGGASGAATDGGSGGAG
jgi:hypothetical protein